MELICRRNFSGYSDTSHAPADSSAMSNRIVDIIRASTPTLIGARDNFEQKDTFFSVFELSESLPKGAVGGNLSFSSSSLISSSINKSAPAVNDETPQEVGAFTRAVLSESGHERNYKGVVGSPDDDGSSVDSPPSVRKDKLGHKNRFTQRSFSAKKAVPSFENGC